jgi:hypothetical protein
MKVELSANPELNILLGLSGFYHAHSMEFTKGNMVSLLPARGSDPPVRDIGKYQSHAISICAKATYSFLRIPYTPGERRCQSVAVKYDTP